MSYDNNVDLSLLVGGAGLLRKQIRSIIESILPCPGVPEQDWVSFVRNQGGPLLFAKKVVGDDNVTLLRSWLKRQREEVQDTDFEGAFGRLPAVVYGQVNNLIALREQDCKSNGLSEAFRAVFETSVARKCYGADAEKHLQPDYDRMEEYSEIGPKNRGLYLGRFRLDYFRKGIRPNGLVQLDSGSTRHWVIDIRHSADFDKPNVFTPVAKLGIGMKAYDLDSIKEFVNRFYNSPERLIWRKVGYGAKQRWSVWMASPKSGWIWAPLSHKSSRKVDLMAKGFQKYTRKVYKKGDRWISARLLARDTVHKDGSWREGLLLVTVGKVIEATFSHPAKLLREVSQDTTPFCSPATPAGPFQGPVIPLTNKGKPRKTKLKELVFSEPCVEKRKQVQVIKEVTMGFAEWGMAVKKMLKQGWSLHEV